jgi:hypothetical protein
MPSRGRDRRLSQSEHIGIHYTRKRLHAMNPHELSELKSRFLSAKTHNFLIADADNYADQLEKISGPVPGDFQRGSVDHLLALTDKAIKSPKSEKLVGRTVSKPKEEAPKVHVETITTTAEMKTEISTEYKEIKVTETKDESKPAESKDDSAKK